MHLQIVGRACGGIVGWNADTTISYCYNTGNIKAGKMIGGIAGENYNVCQAYNCYNVGKIETTEYNVENSTSDFIGGILSRVRNAGVISCCYNKGEIISNVLYSSGGIVGGAAWDNENEPQTVIEKSYNSGNITAKNQQIGGIVGSINSSGVKLNNCYILDTITIKNENKNAEKNIGDSTTECVGKIIGYGTNTSNYTNIGTLTSSQMPTVYEVVNGLNSENSQHWSNSNLEQPKLLWEK